MIKSLLMNESLLVCGSWWLAQRIPHVPVRTARYSFARCSFVCQHPPAAFWVDHCAALPDSWSGETKESRSVCTAVSVLLWTSNQMLWCSIGVWLPVCSVHLNLAKLMRRGFLASGKNRDLAYLLRKGPDCRSCNRVALNRHNAAEPVEVYTYRLEWNLSAPLPWWIRDRTQIWWNLGVIRTCALFPHSSVYIRESTWSPWTSTISVENVKLFLLYFFPVRNMPLLPWNCNFSGRFSDCIHYAPQEVSIKTELAYWLTDECTALFIYVFLSEYFNSILS